MKKLSALLVLSLLCAACQTVESQRQAQLDAAAENAGEAEGAKKQSLDKMLDEHDKVTLVDDDTGEERLVCRRIKPPLGTRLGSRKICATQKQWEEEKRQSEQEIKGIQRNMDARCSATDSAC